MSRFEDALPLILRLEGGRVDNPDDRGGRTNYGITQGTYNRWRAVQGFPPGADVWDITLEEVRAIYAVGFWAEAHCHQLPWPVAVVQFDGAVNHGPKRAIHLLQEALNVKVDGIVGPVTLAAAEGADPEQLANEVLWLRVALYYEISARPGQLQFLRGWLRRLLHVRKKAGLA